MKRNTMTFVESRNAPWVETDKGVHRKILGHDSELMMVRLRFEKGAVGTLHHHIHRQVSYIESGRFEVTIDDEKKTLEKGDCFFIAPHITHGVLALEAGTLIDVFAPARQDFL